jgi:hypothetical protein
LSTITQTLVGSSIESADRSKVGVGVGEGDDGGVGLLEIAIVEADTGGWGGPDAHPASTPRRPTAATPAAAHRIAQRTAGA